jgi:Domain of unknown function (DUF4397)
MLMAGPAASASADSSVRVVNAAAGSDPVSLEVSTGGDSTAAGTVAFRQASGWVDVAAGSAKLTLTAAGGSDPAATGDATFKDGWSYTVVALSKGQDGLSLQTLRSGRPSGGEARLRVVHAAPELGSPDIMIGERTIAQGVSFRSASDYLTLEPGTYELAVTKPDGGDPVFSKQISLAAGTASTVIVAGSGGSAAQAIMVQDAAATPGGAPDTGLGGLAGGDGPPWALALIAALAAGSLGGALQLRRLRRGRP